MFILHSKAINTTPCNNITYTGDQSKSNIKKINKNLWLYHDKEDACNNATKEK